MFQSPGCVTCSHRETPVLSLGVVQTLLSCLHAFNLNWCSPHSYLKDSMDFPPREQLKSHCQAGYSQMHCKWQTTDNQRTQANIRMERLTTIYSTVYLSSTKVISIQQSFTRIYAAGKPVTDLTRLHFDVSLKILFSFQASYVNKYPNPTISFFHKIQLTVNLQPFLSHVQPIFNALWENYGL